MAGRVWQSELRHVSVLHGTGYYGAYVKIDPRRFPSSEAAPPVPGNQIFYMAQEELLRERQPGSGWTFTTWYYNPCTKLLGIWVAFCQECQQ